AVARDCHLHRDRARGSRGSAAAVGSVLVSGVRLRARVRLALERRDHHRVRRGQGRAEGRRRRARLLRRGRQGQRVAEDAAADRRILRSDRPRRPLVYASRTAAKVDSAAVQDGYQLYHHVFFFTAGGDWCVVQQGMSDAARTARRYHWLSDSVKSFVDEPHEAVCCGARGETLNLVAHENDPVRRASAELAAQKPEVTLDALRRGGPACPPEGRHMGRPLLVMPARHTLFPELDVASPYLEKILLKTYERAPQDFETLLGIEGVGPKTLRALALASELVHGTPAAMRDPARFAFAHGGKDGTPFPVDKLTYDKTIEILNKAINRAAIDRSD